MSDRRQKNQLTLALVEEHRGEAPKELRGGTESLTVKRNAESPAIGEQWMEEVCGRENCRQALARVKANKGSAGVDGMTVQQLPEHLKQHWPVIREQLLNGTYKPQPVDQKRSRMVNLVQDKADLCAAPMATGGNPEAGRTVVRCGMPNCAGAECEATSSPKPWAVLMARGEWLTRQHFASHCPTLTSTRSGFQD